VTIAYRSTSSAFQGGIDSVLFRYPATVEPTDLALWFAVNKYPPASPAVPSGFGLLRQEIGGAEGTTGVDAGAIYLSVFDKVCDGSEDGLTEAIAVTGGNSVASRSLGYSRTLGTGWSIATAYGLQAAASNAWDVTTEALSLQTGDLLLGFVGKVSDTTVEHDGAHVLTAAGITFGSITYRIGVSTAAGTTSGDDCSMHVFEVPVTSGSDTSPVNVTLGWTGLGVTAGGGVLLVRLRELSAVTRKSSLAMLGVG
jgi:hypothetical protein